MAGYKEQGGPVCTSRGTSQYFFTPQVLSIRGHFFGQLLSCRFSSPVTGRGHLCTSDRNPIMDEHW